MRSMEAQQRKLSRQRFSQGTQMPIEDTKTSESCEMSSLTYDDARNTAPDAQHTDAAPLWNLSSKPANTWSPRQPQPRQWPMPRSGGSGVPFYRRFFCLLLMFVNCSPCLCCCLPLLLLNFLEYSRVFPVVSGFPASAARSPAPRLPCCWLLSS